MQFSVISKTLDEQVVSYLCGEMQLVYSTAIGTAKWAVAVEYTRMFLILYNKF